MAIVAISQQLGSRGIELGQLAARRLGYRFMSGEEVVSEAARIFGVSQEELLVFDMRTPHFWERVRSESHRYVAYFRAVLLKEMAGDKIVVAGRTLAHQLPTTACAIRVRVVAPLSDRVRWTATQEKIDATAAERQVREHDREIKARSQNLFSVDIDEPTVYDLTLNTSSHPIEMLAELLADAARAIDASPDRAALQALSDVAIAAQVHAALLVHPKIRDAEIGVTCKSGAVCLSGPGLVAPWDGMVREVARKIDGVREVEVEAEAPVPPVRSE
jgi:cytidylate kinase